MKKIVILQDTPFDKEGDVLDIKEFRLKYGYFSTSSATDSEVIEHIERERKLYQEELMNRGVGKAWNKKDRIGYWFKIEEVHDEIIYSFEGRKVQLVRDNTNYLYLYDRNSSQYFSIRAIKVWFSHFHDFLFGFSAVKNVGDSDDAYVSSLLFYNNESKMDGIDISLYRPKEKVFSQDPWINVRHHFGDNALKSALTIGGTTGTFAELFHILQDIDDSTMKNWDRILIIPEL